MSEEIKFTEEEIKSINEVRQTYVSIQNAFGRVGISEIRLHQDMDNLANYRDELANKFAETQNKEKELLESITKKYGDGQLDIQSGKFTPVKSTQTETQPSTESK